MNPVPRTVQDMRKKQLAYASVEILPVADYLSLSSVALGPKVYVRKSMHTKNKKGAVSSKVRRGLASLAVAASWRRIAGAM